MSQLKARRCQSPDLRFQYQSTLQFSQKQPISQAPFTQNKPILSTLKIAVTSFKIRSKGCKLRAVIEKNKPKQTDCSNRQRRIAIDDFIDVLKGTICENLCNLWTILSGCVE